MTPPTLRRVSPVWTVARRELLEISRDTRWQVMAGVTVLLIAAALVLGIQQSRRLEREHHAAEVGDRQVWTSQGAKNPHSAAHFGQYAFKPVGPLALADPGIDAYVGNAVYLEAHKQNEVQFRAARDTTLTARMGGLTFAFVLQTILPLMAILLGFSAYSGERERGTLRQLLALGTSSTDLLMGKFVAGMLVLLAMVLLGGLLMGAGLVGFASHGAVEAGAGARLVGILVGYSTYLVGFLALSLGVSARARSSRSALVGLLVFWLLNGFLVPRLSADLVRSADPLPTSLAFREAIAEDKKSQFGHDEKHPGFIAFRDRIFKQYGVQRVEDLPVSFRGLSLREDDEAGYRIFDKHFGTLESRVHAQDVRRSLAGLFFPLLALQPLSMAMAGTDSAHHDHFVHEAEAHRRLIQTAASQDLIDHARNGDSNYVAPESLWERIPAFEYQAPSASFAWRSIDMHLLMLVAWSLACLGFAWAAARNPRLS